MKVCNQCSAKLPDEAKFCGQCGAKQDDIVPVVDHAVAQSVDDVLPVDTEIQSDVESGITEGKREEVVEKSKTEIQGDRSPKTKSKTKESTKKTTKDSRLFTQESILFFALMSAFVVPGILDSLIMLASKQALSIALVLFIEILGMIGALSLGSYYLSTLNGKTASKERLIQAASGILWIYVISVLSLRLLEYLERFAFTNFINMFWIYYIVYVVIVFVAIVAISRIISRRISRLAFGYPGKLFRKPKLFWRTVLLLGFALFYLPDLVLILFSGEFISIPLSFVGTVTEGLFLVYLQAILIKKVVDGVLVNTSADNSVSEDSSTSGIAKFMPMIVGGLAVVIVVYDLISASFVSALDSIEINIQNDMSMGSYYLAAGDIEMAMEMYDVAYAKTSAWVAVAEDDLNTLRQLYYDNPDNEQIEYLLALKTNSIPELERAIFNDKDTATWYFMLMDAYKAQESNKENPLPLDERQTLIRKDMVNACIASHNFINNNITLKDIEGKEKKITQTLNPYFDFMEQYGVYRIINQVNVSGGMNDGIMGQLLTYAEENKDDILAQYMAYSAGRNYLKDGAFHYARTAEAAMRFRDLYLEEIDPDLDVEALTIGVNMEVANTLMELQDFSNAVVYLEEAADLGAEGGARLLAARCYDALENHEKALEMASMSLDENDENYEALNVAMISAMKIGNITESMTYAVDLLELMASLEGLEYLMVDADLYIYVQYLTVWDQTQWTPQMKYQVYPDLDEDQLKILEDNPILDHYVKAIYYTFPGRDFDLAWTHTQALMEAMPNSAQVHYLAGTIHFNKKEFEQAANYYRESLDIDDQAPTLWYALANAYDAMGDYQQAYNCTLEVAELLTYNNHAVDIYGVQIHNERMMAALASKIEQEGN